VKDDDSLPPSDVASRRMLKEHVERVLANFTELERQVVVTRFGLEDGRTRTLEEVGQKFGFSRERARQIEAAVLRKLRRPPPKK
jgi:RNA polymerase primary sigma factor